MMFIAWVFIGILGGVFLALALSPFILSSRLSDRERAKSAERTADRHGV